MRGRVREGGGGSACACGSASETEKGVGAVCQRREGGKVWRAVERERERWHPGIPHLLLDQQPLERELALHVLVRVLLQQPRLPDHLFKPETPVNRGSGAFGSDDRRRKQWTRSSWDRVVVIHHTSGYTFKHLQSV